MNLPRSVRGYETKVRVEVFFEAYRGLEEPREESEAWLRAKAWDWANVRVGDGRREAERLGVKTSGQVLVYDSTGALLFSGGVTRGRGERGESKGATSLRALLTQAAVTDAISSPVYGCELESSRRG